MPKAPVKSNERFGSRTAGAVGKPERGDHGIAYCGRTRAVLSCVPRMQELIRKSDWLTARECVGMAWRLMRAEANPPGEADRFRMEQGQEVGRRARSLFPGGVLIPPGSPHASAARTAEAVAAGQST